jgi:hypothetical protein
MLNEISVSVLERETHHNYVKLGAAELALFSLQPDANARGVVAQPTTLHLPALNRFPLLSACPRILPSFGNGVTSCLVGEGQVETPSKSAERWPRKSLAV